MTFDTVIRGGTIVTAADTFRADIGISGETIRALGHGLSGRREIDAEGLLVMPGGIDGHCHIEQEEADGTVHEDDFASATATALLGGTTSVVSFASHVPGRDIVEQFDAYRRRGEASRIDFAIHQIITRADTRTIDSGIAEVAQRGVAGLKVFLTYDDFHLGDKDFLKVLGAARRSGLIVSVHCENYDAIRHLVDSHLAEGRTEPYAHATSRPRALEREATYRAMSLAELLGAEIQIFHVSCPEVAEEIARARARGVRVTAETCPHYLTLTEDSLKAPGFEGAKYICSPPLRSEEDRNGLWRYLRDGTIDIISSDHCGYTFEGTTGKARNGRDAPFSVIPNGMPGLGTRMPVLFDAAIRNGQLGLNDFVRLTSTTPAQRYGLYPRKGTIAPGNDADLVLWNPDRKITIRNNLFKGNIDYTPYEGQQVQGWPDTVIARGQIAVHHGKLTRAPGAGRYLASSDRRPVMSH